MMLPAFVFYSIIVVVYPEISKDSLVRPVLWRPLLKEVLRFWQAIVLTTKENQSLSLFDKIFLNINQNIIPWQIAFIR